MKNLDGFFQESEENFNKFGKEDFPTDQKKQDNLFLKYLDKSSDLNDGIAQYSIENENRRLFTEYIRKKAYEKHSAHQYDQELAIIYQNLYIQLSKLNFLNEEYIKNIKVTKEKYDRKIELEEENEENSEVSIISYESRDDKNSDRVKKINEEIKNVNTEIVTLSSILSAKFPKEEAEIEKWFSDLENEVN